MKANNVTIAQLNQALQNTNIEHGFRLRWNRQPELMGRWVHFTIRSERSKIYGASISYSGRNSSAASWEAHGYFFAEIWQLAPMAEIRTAHATYLPPTHRCEWSRERWRDYNIGAMCNPMRASANAY